MKSLKLIFAMTLLAVALDGRAAEPLEIWISSHQDKVYYEDMVRLFQSARNEKFAANVKAYGFRELPDKLAVAIKTGVNPPDIVQLDEVLFGTYLRGEVPFVDLTKRVKKTGLDKAFVPQRLSLFSYQGKTYGLPQSLSAMLLYCRTDSLEKYGITPNDLVSWDGFVRVGEELAAKGQAMIGLDPIYFEILLRQRGSDWFGKDGKIFPNEKVAIDILHWLLDLQAKRIGVVPDRGSIFDPVFFNGDIANGEVFCVIGGDWYGLDMIQQFSSDLKGDWGVMPLPAWRRDDGSLGRRTSTFAGQGLMIYKGSKQTDEAWDFIQFVMTNREANVRRYTNGNSFPAYKPAWEDARLRQNHEFFNDQPLGRILMDLAPEVPEVVTHPLRPHAVFLFQESVFSTFMYGQITADKVIELMREQLEQD